VDPFLNPYRPGAGVPPPILSGRESELMTISTMIGRLALGRGDRSIVLTGLRGVGKTALLWAGEEMAEDRGWIVQSLEARADVGFRSALAERAWAALNQLEHRGAAREAVSRLAAMIRRIGLREPETGIEVSLDVGSREAARLETDLVDLFRVLGETARDTGTGVLFLLDELQQAEPAALEALCAAAHDLSKRELPLALLIAGLPPLRDQLLSAKTYAERLFSYRQIGPLSAADAEAALLDPARAAVADFEVERSALVMLLAACEGYPYFIQLFGHALWQVADGPHIGSEEMEAALSLGRNELETDLYVGRWKRASGRSRDYMAAMAALGDGPVSSGAVAEEFGGHRAAATIRDGLIDDGLIYSPARGEVAFTVPGFADFIRRTQAAQPSTV
jgi:AAA ATPase-like protein